MRHSHAQPRSAARAIGSHHWVLTDVDRLTAFPNMTDAVRSWSGHSVELRPVRPDRRHAGQGVDERLTDCHAPTAVQRRARRGDPGQAEHAVRGRPLTDRPPTGSRVTGIDLHSENLRPMHATEMERATVRVSPPTALVPASVDDGDWPLHAQRAGQPMLLPGAARGEPQPPAVPRLALPTARRGVGFGREGLASKVGLGRAHVG